MLLFFCVLNVRFVSFSDCQQPLVDFSAFLGQEIDDVTEEIRLLNVNKNSLRNIVDCNSYSQQNSNLLRKYSAVYSRLTMYASIRAALKKLKSRIDAKFKECERDSGEKVSAFSNFGFLC